MDKLVSKIMIVGSDPANRIAAVAAVARTQAQVTLANDPESAIEQMQDPDELPDLIIRNLDYENPDEPLKLYRYMQRHEATRGIPFLFVVGSEFEVGMLKSLKLAHSFVTRAPLRFGSLVFALPALGLRIRESMLYQEKNDFVAA